MRGRAGEGGFVRNSKIHTFLETQLSSHTFLESKNSCTFFLTSFINSSFSLSTSTSILIFTIFILQKNDLVYNG